MPFKKKTGKSITVGLVLVMSRIMPFSWIPGYTGMTISELISGKYGTRHTRAGGYPAVAKTFYDFINIDDAKLCLF